MSLVTPSNKKGSELVRDPRRTRMRRVTVFGESLRGPNPFIAKGNVVSIHEIVNPICYQFLCHTFSKSPFSFRSLIFQTYPVAIGLKILQEYCKNILQG